MRQYGSFEEAIKNAKFSIHRDSQLVAPATWQSVDVTKRPEMVTHEVQWFGFKAETKTTMLDAHRRSILPNTPWADDHFEERVSGYPLNPGVQWENWPYAKSADLFRDQAKQFNHSYAERYWPKHASKFATFLPTDAAVVKKMLAEDDVPVHRGIRYNYGDLGDVAQQLARDPLTRQAVLPVFFPEDTGAVHGDRVPCSIFYQFLIRNQRLDIFYYLRSCDFVRHFRDDIYLTVRLQLWMIEWLRARDIILEPGLFLMQISSLHIFRNDWEPLFKEVYRDRK